MRRAFTLMEMVVALGIMAIVMSFAGVIFRVSTDSHRLALANAEIMQKLRAITEQLDSDFRGLRKDGEILVFWRAERKANYTGSNRNAEEAFDRFDRIMFFAQGDFQTYRANPTVRGNMAWISYALASGPSANPAEPNRPQRQKPERRVLARTEHILVAPLKTLDPNDPLGTGKFTDDQWRDWMSSTEYDVITMRGWETMPVAAKVDLLSVIGDVQVVGAQGSSTKNSTIGGVTLDPNKPGSLHAFMCRGVGQFQVQGWSDTDHRWIPQVNPNGDERLQDDSDFVLEGDEPHGPDVPGGWNPHQGSDLHPQNVPGIWYPHGPAIIGNTAINPLDRDFYAVPGLGRALKFTFTLYDSRGLVKGGRAFTHIVYLDN